MRTAAILLLAFLFAASCKEDKKAEEKKENKDLLSTDLVNNPRSAEGTDTAALNALPTMDFTDTMHAFGTVREGETVTHDFTFTNHGKRPLIVSDATASCGCTVPEFPHEPILSGKSGVIKVKFNSAGKTGSQTKSVAVITNSARGVHTLYLKGEVTPENK
jgi:hypothetical protein